MDSQVALISTPEAGASRIAYDVAYGVAFAIVLPAALLARMVPRENAFVRGLKQSRETVFRVEKQGEMRSPRLAVLHDNLADTNRVLNQLVYQKGGWTLHMLRGQMGTDKFWAGIRDYYKRYRDGNATTDDLRQVMEKQAGGAMATATCALAQIFS